MNWIYDNTSVRRQDRLLDEPAARRLLAEGEYGFLAMVRPDGAGGYGLPISYVWDGADCLYLHCAPEGEKLRALDRCAAVTFCVVGATRLHPARFTTEYESILLRCHAERRLSPDERMEALRLLLDKYSPDDREVGMRYAAGSFHRTEIIRLRIGSASGKCKRIRTE